MIELSVIIPCHNAAPYLADTMRGLCSNAGPGIEFIFIDDCGTDGTPELLDQLAATVPGAHLIHHRTNQGLASARNTGLDAARGTYLTFLDADDWFHPGYLAALLATMRELDVDFVRVGHITCHHNKRALAQVPHGPPGVALKPREAILPASRTTSVDYPYAWAGIYHRRLLDNGLLHFPAGLHTAEDRPWIWGLHLGATSFAVSTMAGVYYRRAIATSLTQVGDARQLDFIRAMDAVIDLVGRDAQSGDFLPKAVRTYCALIAHHLRGIDRFSPELAGRLRREAAIALRSLPADVVVDTLAALDPERAERLRHLMTAKPSSARAR